MIKKKINKWNFVFETRPFFPKGLVENIESENDPEELQSSMQDDGTPKHVRRVNYSKKIIVVE